MSSPRTNDVVKDHGKHDDVVEQQHSKAGVHQPTHFEVDPTNVHKLAEEANRRAQAHHDEYVRKSQAEHKAAQQVALDRLHELEETGFNPSRHSKGE